MGSAGGSQESESSSGVGQSSGGDGVDGEEQEESSSSHVVCGIEILICNLKVKYFILTLSTILGAEI